MGFRYDIAIRSTHKYAVRASGDVARAVDLPDGGVALLVIDGQGSGPAARAVARDVAARLTWLLEAGASADVAAIATNQALAAGRSGQVSASFDVVRAQADGAFDIARFSTNRLWVRNDEGWSSIGGDSLAGGRNASAHPDRFHCALDEASMLLIATDGANVTALESSLDHVQSCANPAAIVGMLFQRALSAVDGRPKDDVTVAMLVRSEVPAEQRFEQLDYRRDVR